MFSVIRLFCSFSFFLSGLMAVQILPEIGEGTLHHKLQVALYNCERSTVLEILNNNHDSLRSTQKGANLAIKACAIYGGIALYRGFLEPRVCTYFCCINYDSSCYSPDDKGTEAAYLEAAKCRDVSFLQKIPLPADSNVRRLIYKSTFEELIGSKNVSDYLCTLFYLADHLGDDTADSLKKNFTLQQRSVAHAQLSYAVSAQSYNDDEEDL